MRRVWPLWVGVLLLIVVVGIQSVGVESLGLGPLAFTVVAWLLGACAVWAAYQARPDSRPPAGFAPERRQMATHLPATVEEAVRDLETVEGIGAGYGRRLRDLGVPHTRGLVDRGKEAAAREELAALLKVEPLVVRRWTSMADLLRVPGMDGQSAEVLEAAGVGTVTALAQGRAATLVALLLEVNERLRLTPGDLPGVDQVENWIGLAGLLPPLIDDL